MSNAGKKLIESAKQALAFAKGEAPAARITVKGHAYVPAAEYEQMKAERDHLLFAKDSDREELDLVYEALGINGTMSPSDEIRRLRTSGIEFANWIEQLYGDLPSDRAPGPPRQLVKDMRAAFGQHTAGEK